MFTEKELVTSEEGGGFAVEILERKNRGKRGKVLGAGIYKAGKFVASRVVDGKRVMTKEYEIWHDMLKRAYCERFLARNTAYIGVKIDPKFLDFQDFCQWLSEQIRYESHDKQLDKDLILKGNKVYGPSTCVLLPKEVNGLLIRGESSRGTYPIGVHLEKGSGKYKAQCNLYEVYTNLGRFSTPEAAFAAYKVAKEAYIKVVAKRWKEEIDPRAYAALMNYTVEIDD